MKPYVPDSLPLTNLDHGRLIRLIGPANAALARYDGLLQSVINPRVMLSPLTNQEAVLVERSGIPKNTALPFLRKLRDVGILSLLREKSGRRSAILAFSELLNRAEGRKIL